MAIASKKIVLWISVGASMILVFIIWAVSWQTYNISGSKKQAQELRDKVQENLKQINMPEVPKLDASIISDISELELLLPLSE